jgi:hypothetical protein
MGKPKAKLGKTKSSSKSKITITLVVLGLILGIAGALSYFLYMGNTFTESEASQIKYTCGYIKDSCSVVTINPHQLNNPSEPKVLGTSIVSNKGDIIRIDDGNFIWGDPRPSMPPGENKPLNCTWCGTRCIPASNKMACPLIAPPTGTSCVQEGNKCVTKSAGIMPQCGWCGANCQDMNGVDRKQCPDVKWAFPPGECQLSGSSCIVLPPNRPSLPPISGPVEVKNVERISKDGTKLCVAFNDSTNSQYPVMFDRIRHFFKQSSISESSGAFNLGCREKELPQPINTKRVNPNSFCGFCGDKCNKNNSCGKSNSSLTMPKDKICVTNFIENKNDSNKSSVYRTSCSIENITTAPVNKPCSDNGNKATCFDSCSERDVNGINYKCEWTGTECRKGSIICNPPTPPSPTPKIVGQNCGWCGATCVDWNLKKDMACIQIAPPTNQKCVAEAGKCVMKEITEPKPTKCGWCGYICTDLANQPTGMSCPKQTWRDGRNCVQVGESCKVMMPSIKERQERRFWFF